MISIIIRTWNALAYTKITVQSIIEHTQDTDYEFIIVDNGSGKDTQEYIETIKKENFFRKLKIILNKENLGVAYASKQGVEVAEGEYICMVDNDILVPDKWLSTMLIEMQVNHAKINGPNKFDGLVYPNTSISMRVKWNEIEALGITDPYKSFLKFSEGEDITAFSQRAMKFYDKGIKHKQCPPFYTGGCCLLFEKKFAESVGGFINKEYGLYGSEDIDFCWRVGKQGGIVIRSGVIYIHHFEHSSIEFNNLDLKQHLIKGNTTLFNYWKDDLYVYIKQELTNGSTIEEIRTHNKMLKIFIDGEKLYR